MGYLTPQKDLTTTANSFLSPLAKAYMSASKAMGITKHTPFDSMRKIMGTPLKPEEIDNIVWQRHVFCMRSLIYELCTCFGWFELSEDQKKEKNQGQLLSL